MSSRISASAGVLSALVLLCASTATAQSNSYYEFLIARHLEAQGDQDGALAALERASTADPRSAEVRAEIASYYLRRNRRADAESSALSALKLDDRNAAAHRVLGLIYSANVDGMNARTPAPQVQAALRDAIQHLEGAIVTEGETGIDILYALGRMYMRAGDASKAVDAFTRVVSQNPGSAQGRLSLAQAYAATRDTKSAIGVLDEIVEVEPRVAAALAQYQEDAGLYREAAANYTRALAVQPMSRGLAFRRVAALFNARDFMQAASFAAEAQAQFPDDLRFPQLQARSLFALGDKTKAVSVLETTAKANPKDTATQLAMADLYHDASRDADAERTLRQFLEIDPANAEALNYLGYLLAQNGKQLDEAIRLVERALNVEPGNPSYLDSLGWAYFRRGDMVQAERYLSPAAEQLPRNAVVQDHLGDVLARIGRLQDAVAAWTRALSADGEIDKAAIQKKIDDARSKIPNR
jgi:tetratricopeptide (TPR) repeat protein